MLTARKLGWGPEPIPNNAVPAEVPATVPGHPDVNEVLLTVYCSDVKEAFRNDSRHGGSPPYSPETKSEGAKEYVMVRV